MARHFNWPRYSNSVIPQNKRVYHLSRWMKQSHVSTDSPNLYPAVLRPVISKSCEIHLPVKQKSLHNAACSLEAIREEDLEFLEADAY